MRGIAKNRNTTKTVSKQVVWGGLDRDYERAEVGQKSIKKRTREQSAKRERKRGK
jgi:hypothetical protein